MYTAMIGDNSGDYTAFLLSIMHRINSKRARKTQPVLKLRNTFFVTKVNRKLINKTTEDKWLQGPTALSPKIKFLKFNSEVRQPN